jgi:hypothetical protein
MKRTVLVLLAVAGLAFAMNLSNAQSEKPAKVLRHVVLFKFKSDATKDQVQKIVDELAALPKKIDTIIGYEHGLNNSKEGRSKGFTHCFTITFKDEAGRDKYLPHPAHADFVKVALPMIEDVLVVDYWADPPAK